MLCPNCQSPSFHRAKRKGFLQSRIAPLFGYYPWHCTQCKSNCMLRKRGERRRHPGRAERRRPRT